MNQELAIDICGAVHPVVAAAAQRDDIVQVEPQLGMARPRSDVMGVQGSWGGLLCAASLACVAIPGIDRTHHGSPFRRSVLPLALRAAAVAVVRVRAAGPPVHSIASAAEPGLGTTCCVRQLGARFVAMVTTFPVRHVSRLRPTVVVPMQVVSAWPGLDSEVAQLLIDAFWVAVNQLCNVVRRQALRFVLLTEPIGIKVRRLHAGNSKAVR